VRRRSLEELAAEAGTTPDWIAELVEAGAIGPRDDDAFRSGNVQRAAIVDACEGGTSFSR
jgi:hypothetical protein